MKDGFWGVKHETSLQIGEMLGFEISEYSQNWEAENADPTLCPKILKILSEQNLSPEMMNGLTLFLLYSLDEAHFDDCATSKLVRNGIDFYANELEKILNANSSLSEDINFYFKHHSMITDGLLERLRLL